MSSIYGIPYKNSDVFVIFSQVNNQNSDITNAKSNMLKIVGL